MANTSAVLKLHPTDFVVREVMVPTLVRHDEAKYRLLLLRKSGYTTFEAIRLIAATLDVTAETVTYAGLKDEDGITEQLVAVPVDTTVVAAPSTTVEQSNRWIEWSPFGFTREPLRIGGLVGNAFRIVVRNLQPDLASRMAQQRKILGFTLNYYDTQRFGVPGGPKRTHHVGHALLTSDWDSALRELVGLRAPESEPARRWTGTAREFFVNADARLCSFYLAAHSSYIWNQTVRITAAEAFADPGELVVKDGIEFLMPAHSADVVRLMAHAAVLPYRRYSFTAAGIAETMSSRATALQTSISVAEQAPDADHPGRSQVTLDFFLPSGCYATSAVLQILRYCVS